VTTPTRVGHAKQDGGVYIGRVKASADKYRHLRNTPPGEDGWLGNPFRVDEYGSDTAIRKYAGLFADCLAEDPQFRAAVWGLRGHVLGGWCRSLGEDAPPCHGDVIAAHVDALDPAPCEPPHRVAEDPRLGIRRCVDCGRRLQAIHDWAGQAWTEVGERG
jgi:hypothetical protein